MVDVLSLTGVELQMMNPNTGVIKPSFLQFVYCIAVYYIHTTTLLKGQRTISLEQVYPQAKANSLEEAVILPHTGLRYDTLAKSSLTAVCFITEKTCCLNDTFTYIDSETDTKYSLLPCPEGRYPSRSRFSMSHVSTQPRICAPTLA